MKRKNKFLIVLCMATVFGVGCSSNYEENESSISDTKNEAKNSPDESSEEEVTVWAWDKTFNGFAMEEADKIYNDADINFVEMGKADVLQKLHTVLASGVTDELPEVVAISDLNAQGYLMSYPGSFKAVDEKINYNDFAAYKEPMLSFDGVGYGVPFDTGVAGLFYRKDYIEEVGYTEEDMQNLTWDKYIALGELLKEKGHYLQTYNPNDVSEFQIMLQSAGTWFTDEAGNANFENNEALKQCFEIFKTFNDSDNVKLVSDWTEFTGAINSGDVACVIRGSWISPTIMQEPSQSGLWSVAPVPSLNVELATNYSNQGGSSWFILENSTNADVALDFLANTFASSTELYNTLLGEKNIMGTYLPAGDVDAFNIEMEFYGGQKLNADLANWLSKIPAVYTGAYSAEAQEALKAVMPTYLQNGDLQKALEDATIQYSQMVQ
ncbi:MAG: ABC transporter substrate-binding protein [Lachnospirales bacterium]